MDETTEYETSYAKCKGCRWKSKYLPVANIEDLERIHLATEHPFMYKMLYHTNTVPYISKERRFQMVMITDFGWGFIND